jgi:NAD(P)-dependent dehydrogenase (short-subunit alcohol dehydrogenase family)
LSKTIVITGGGAGLGLTLARAFVADGHAVVLLGRTFSKVDAAAAGIGEKAMAVECDVASPASVKRAFAAVAERFPKIDVLINNAAIFIPSAVADASDDLIVQTININLTGAILCARAAIPMLGEGGQIINITSESVDLPFAHLSLYQSSKAGLERFSMSLHRELEDQGIRVGFVRAGSMVGGEHSMDGDPEAWMRFFQACERRGLRLLERPNSNYASLIQVFRLLIDMPADLHAASIGLHAFGPGIPATQLLNQS